MKGRTDEGREKGWERGGERVAKWELVSEEGTDGRRDVRRERQMSRSYG